MPNMFDVVNAVCREIEPRGCEILHTHRFSRRPLIKITRPRAPLPGNSLFNIQVVVKGVSREFQAAAVCGCILYWQ